MSETAQSETPDEARERRLLQELVEKSSGGLQLKLEGSRRGLSVCVRTSRARRREIAERPTAKAGPFSGGFSAA